MPFQLRLTREAEEDLEQLFDFIVQRELDRNKSSDLQMAQAALDAIEKGFETLKLAPFTCRKSAQNPFLRELIISFGHSGYVALFEIENEKMVTIAAVRYQNEDDYHWIPQRKTA